MEGYAIADHFVYTAYGEVKTWYGSTPYVDGPLFAGYFFDAETRLYLARNRYYNASTATWINRDPMGYFYVGVGSLIAPLIGNNNTWFNMPGNAVNSGAINDFSLYRYVHNRPLIFIDPEGTAMAAAVPGAIGCACADGPLPIGDIVGCCLLAGALAWDLCHRPPPPKCPPCPPPPQPPPPRYDTGHPHFPCKGAHTHIYWFETNQEPYPSCKCHNNLREYVICH